MTARCLGLVILTLATSAVHTAADAQDRNRVYRIGVLEREAADYPNFMAFRQQMKQLGYVEGKTLTLEYRNSQGRDSAYVKDAAEIVALKVDLILARGTPAVLAAKRATRTIPIVMSGAGDPVTDGLINSLARPGGNVTGFTASTAELSGKRLQVLRELLPKLGAMGALMNMSNPNLASQRRQVETAAQSLRIEVRVFDVRTAAELEQAFDDAARQRLPAMYVALDTLTQVNRELIGRLALKHRLPTMSPAAEYVEAGNLISYGPSFPAIYRGAANVADRILKGTKPENIPVEQPSVFELVVNKKTATALGISIPNQILVQADRLIE